MTADELNMFCYTEFEIGMFGSSYFVGFAISGVILKICDYLGRKNML